MEPEKSHAGDQLSQLLSAYDPAMPEDLAAKTLARLLQSEPDRGRRRALLKAFAGRIEELQNGLGCTIAVVSIGDCSVVVPTSATSAGQSADSADSRSERSQVHSARGR